MKRLEELQNEYERLQEQLTRVKRHLRRREEEFAALTSSPVFKAWQAVVAFRKNIFSSPARKLNAPASADIPLHMLFQNAGNVVTAADIEASTETDISAICKEIAPELVSVIILHHGDVAVTKECVTHIIKNTTHQGYEVIVFANGTDPEEIKMGLHQIDDKKITVLSSPQNLSFSAANNTAALAAKGSYLIFLNNDTMPLHGWLEHLVFSARKNTAGITGARLIYPERPPGKQGVDQRFPDYTIQHEGIYIERRENTFLPVNISKGDNPFSCNALYEKNIIAVTGACLCIRTNLFNKLHGFDEQYIYGYEDVDLCLRAVTKGETVRYVPASVVYHHEFKTQHTVLEQKQMESNRLQNKEIFSSTWHSRFVKEALLDRYKKQNIYSRTPFTVAFIVSSTDPSTIIGDYFTAMNLGKYLIKEGMRVLWITKNDTAADVDVYVNLLADVDLFELKQLQLTSGITVAWIRNHYDTWKKQEHFSQYDIVLTSSRHISELKNKPYTHHFLLAADTEFFYPHSNKEYFYDALFVGSNTGIHRDIFTYLQHLPEEFSSYKIAIFGEGIASVPALKKYYIGPISYAALPYLYNSAHVVLENHHIFTRSEGFINSRIFEAAACGATILTDTVPGLDTQFASNDYYTYSSQDTFIAALKTAITSAKKKPADYQNNLTQEILTQHTYEKRAEQFKDIIYGYLKSL